MSPVMREVTLELSAFDRDAQRLVAAAQAMADARMHARVEPLHVLYSAIERSPLLSRALGELLDEPTDLLLEAEALLRTLPARPAGAAFLSEAVLVLLRRAAAQVAPARANVLETLLALLQAGDPLVAATLASCDVHPQALRVGLKLAAQLVPPPLGFASDASAPTLDALLTRFARPLAPADDLEIAGRDSLIERIMQVLARRDQSHPLLVGEHGVGRKSLVHALAQRIARGEVPPHLVGKRIAALDLSALLVGARLRGELDERAGAFFAALLATAGGVLLYVSDLGALLAPRLEPWLDALLAALSRGGVQLIAVAAPSALADPAAEALLRSMVRIEVDEPSEAAALPMLRAASKRLGSAHGLRITDEALASAAQLARRYVPAAHLPKSALDVLDEAAAMQSLRARANERPSTTEGPELGVAEVAHAVAVATGVPVARVQQSEAEKLLALEAQLGRRVIGQPVAVTALSDAVRRGRVGLRDPKRPIGSFLFLGSSGVGKTELAKALAEVLFDDEHALTRIDMSELMEKHSVARLLGSPPGYVDSDQGGFLTEAVRRRPYSVVLLDEIEKAHPDVFNVLLQVLDDGRLSDSRGRLAHFADTVIIMTSNIGARRLSGPSEALIEPSAHADAAAVRAAAHAAVMTELRSTLRPELLNRIDEIVIFEALGKPELLQILSLQIEGVRRQLAPRGVSLTVTEAAASAIVDLAYDPAFGARPLRRVLQQELLDPLATQLLGAHPPAGVVLDALPDGAGEARVLSLRAEPVFEGS